MTQGFKHGLWYSPFNDSIKGWDMSREFTLWLQDRPGVNLEISILMGFSEASKAAHDYPDEYTTWAAARRLAGLPYTTDEEVDWW